MLKECISNSVLLLVSCLCSLCYAEIDLFDRNRAKPESSPIIKKAPVAVRPEKIATPEKKLIELTLVGISQTGRTVLYFKDGSNKQIKLVFDKQKINTLPGYKDLVIKTIENRSLIIDDPNNQCKDDKSMGISCQASNRSIEMTLVRNHSPKPRSIVRRTNRIINSRGNSRNNPQKTQRNVIPARSESKRRVYPRSKSSSPRARRVIKTPFGERNVTR